MRRAAVVIALAVVAVACSPQRRGISVRIDGWGNDTVFVGHWEDVNRMKVADTVMARRGKFEVPVADTVPLATVWRAGVHEQSTPYVTVSTLIFAMPPEGRMKVRGTAYDEYVEYSVEGSPLNAEIAEYRDRVRESCLENNELLRKMKSGATGEEVQRMEKALGEARMRRGEAILEFIDEHPASEWSVYLLAGKVDNDDKLMKLTENAREGRFRPMYDEQMARMEEFRQELKKEHELTGKPAPDFAAVDMDGGEFLLSKFDAQGKYVVLDFWGSWCVPCIAGMPKMKKYYEAHKERLEIIGIACFDKEEAWKKAVADNALPWVNVLDGGSAPEVYNLMMYPTKIILSPDKTVVAVCSGESDELYRKLDELFKK